MSTTHRLRFPLDEATARTLRAGDMVIMDGEIVITAGLPTHQRIADFVAENRELPTDLRHGTLFHLGSFSRAANGQFEVLYMNPTTSTRFNPYMPGFIRKFGLHAVGGKGGLDAECARAMQAIGCVYLSFLGGGCTLHSAAIKGVVSVQWDDLIAHYRLVTLRIEGLGPATVAIDAHGVSLYDQLHADANARLADILAGMDQARAAQS